MEEYGTYPVETVKTDHVILMYAQHTFKDRMVAERPTMTTMLEKNNNNMIFSSKTKRTINVPSGCVSILSILYFVYYTYLINLNTLFLYYNI